MIGKRMREKDDRKEDEGKGGEVGMEKKANETRVCCMLTCFKSLCNTYFFIHTNCNIKRVRGREPRR